MINGKFTGVFLVGALCCCLLTLPVPVFATDDGLTKTEKSEILRDEMKQRARDLLSRPDVSAADIDHYFSKLDKEERDLLRYDLLNEQISYLASVVRSLRQRSRLLPPPLPQLAPPKQGATLDSIYGPNGPTVKSVRVLLEYRLMIIGNPRLKVGKIFEDATKVVAHVVTVDGSIVDKFTIDKNTGAWTTIR